MDQFKKGSNFNKINFHTPSSTNEYPQAMRQTKGLCRVATLGFA